MKFELVNINVDEAEEWESEQLFNLKSEYFRMNSRKLTSEKERDKEQKKEKELEEIEMSEDKSLPKLLRHDTEKNEYGEEEKV